MPGLDYFMKPKTSDITVALEEVHNTLYSLLLLDNSSDVSGLSSRISNIYTSMSDELLKRNHLVLNGLYYAVIPNRSIESFDSYLTYLRDVDPVILRDQILKVYLEMYRANNDDEISKDTILQDDKSYLTFLIKTFGQEKIDESIEHEAYKYIVNPVKLKDLVVFHLTEMWDLYMKDEWMFNKSILEESIDAFREAGIETMAKAEAVKFIGCESMDCDWDLFLNKIKKAKKIYLVPSAHLGPYKGKIYHMESEELWIFYGSLIPEGSGKNHPKLSKADILVHVSALNDGVRLEILKSCSTGKEYSSTQLMNLLNISQSAVSRHLKQLSATGFLVERRENSSKYYKINKEKIKSTMGSLSGYLDLDSDNNSHSKNNGGSDV